MAEETSIIGRKMAEIAYEDALVQLRFAERRASRAQTKVEEAGGNVGECVARAWAAYDRIIAKMKNRLQVVDG